jgi:hypothetical protein
MELPSPGVDGDERSIGREKRDGKVCGLWGRESGWE